MDRNFDRRTRKRFKITLNDFVEEYGSERAYRATHGPGVAWDRGKSTIYVPSEVPRKAVKHEHEPGLADYARDKAGVLLEKASPGEVWDVLQSSPETDHIREHLEHHGDYEIVPSKFGIPVSTDEIDVFSPSFDDCPVL